MYCLRIRARLGVQVSIGNEAATPKRLSHGVVWSSGVPKGKQDGRPIVIWAGELPLRGPVGIES